MPHNLKFAIFGAGFIGKALLRQLISNGYRPNVLDHNAPPEEFATETSWVVGAFDDKTLQKETLRDVDVAFHLISTTVPGDDTVNAIRELSDNLFSTLTFIDTCRSCHVRRVVFVSSSSVYGLQAAIPIPESAITNPISSHGIQKLTIEKYLLLNQFLYGIDVRIIRLSNPYGPGQNPFGRQGFIALAIGRLLKNEPIVLRDCGRPIRDFIYIDDVSRALTLAGTAEGAPAILNVGSGIGHSIRQVVEMLGEITRSDVMTLSGEARKIDIPISVLDVSMIRRSLGFEPTCSLREGMIKTLQNHKILPQSSLGLKSQ
jgi:UDP-glucose 4-epimerase